MENKNEKPLQLYLKTMSKQKSHFFSLAISVVASITSLFLPVSLLLGSVHSSSSTWPFSPHRQQERDSNCLDLRTVPQSHSQLISASANSQDTNPGGHPDAKTIRLSYSGWPEWRLWVEVLFQKPPRENSPELGTLLLVLVSDTSQIVCFPVNPQSIM